jgi:hypothetical protein
MRQARFYAGLLTFLGQMAPGDTTVVTGWPAASRACRTARSLAGIIGTGPSAFSVRWTVEILTPVFSARSTARHLKMARAARTCSHASIILWHLHYGSDIEWHVRCHDAIHFGFQMELPRAGSVTRKRRRGVDAPRPHLTASSGP